MRFSSEKLQLSILNQMSKGKAPHFEMTAAYRDLEE